MGPIDFDRLAIVRWIIMSLLIGSHNLFVQDSWIPKVRLNVCTSSCYCLCTFTEGKPPQFRLSGNLVKSWIWVETSPSGIVTSQFITFWLSDAMHCDQLTPSSVVSTGVLLEHTALCTHTHTLKSNNPVQFNNKAAAGESNQSFPLAITQRYQGYALLFTFWACVSGCGEFMVQGHSAASCSVHDQMPLAQRCFSWQTNTHSHVV